MSYPFVHHQLQIRNHSIFLLPFNSIQFFYLISSINKISHPVHSLGKCVCCTRLYDQAHREFNRKENRRSMSCLLPQFKCQPDSFPIHKNFRPPNHQHHTVTSSNLSRNKDFLCFRTQCVLSTTSPSTSTVRTAVLDVEKLRLPSFEAHSSLVTPNRPWTYTGEIGSQSEAKVEAALATETLLTNDEAVIAAAAAEAVALARVAAKVAKETANFYSSYSSRKAEIKSSVPSTSDTLAFKWNQFTETERAGIVGDLHEAETGPGEDDLLQSLKEYDDLDLYNEELDLLQDQFSESITVRSNRQTERKEKRAKAAEKAGSSVVSMKSNSTSKKKRSTVQEVDYSDPLRYLRGTSSSKLLTAREETILSGGIQDLLKLEKLQTELTEKFGTQPTLSQWAAAAGVDLKTLRSRLNYGTRCKDRMITSNVRLVISIAKNYQGAGMNLQDLVQEGCRGLVRGAEKFDASKGFKFSTYAHWWIKQSVRKSLSDQSRIIRLPFHMVEATYRVKEAKKHLLNENGRHPSDEEVAEATGLTMKRVSAVQLAPKAPRSLDQKIGYNQNLKISEITSNPDALTSEEILIKQFMKKDLEKVLDGLSTRERQVIRWRFGMEDGRMKTLQEIGESLGVSRERIRQIESSAFRKLKNKKRNKQLRQYMNA